MTVANQQTGTEIWSIDPVHSHVEFAVKHMMVSNVRGTFEKVTGTIHFDENDFTRSSVEVTIDPQSINTRDPNRDKHLRSTDFLDAEKFGEITFRSRRIEHRSGDDYRIYGDLTIRGVTREVALDATFEGRIRDPYGLDRAGFSARTMINRKDFGVNWNAPIEAGGFVVGDELRITIDVEAVHKQEQQQKAA